MIAKKTWDEFRNNGLLWFINMILHTFGWAICVELDDDMKVINAYPARTKFRGFSEKNNDDGYKSVAKYLKDNADSIFEDAMKG